MEFIDIILIKIVGYVIQMQRFWTLLDYFNLVNNLNRKCFMKDSKNFIRTINKICTSEY